jgi:hypothetical protein
LIDGHRVPLCGTEAVPDGEQLHRLAQMLDREERLAELELALHAVERDGIALEPLTTSHPDLSVTEAQRIVVMRVELDRLGTVEVRA